MAWRLSLKLRPRRAPEPVSRLPLSWGVHRERTLIGAALVCLGAALIAQTSAFTLSLGVLGTVLTAGGWLVLPGRVRTRLGAALVAVPACWCSLGGAATMWPLALLLPCWLAVRQRPAATWLLTALPVAVGLGLGSLLPFVADKPVVFLGTAAAIAAGALTARELALRVRIRVVLRDSITTMPHAVAPAPVD